MIRIRFLLALVVALLAAQQSAVHATDDSPFRDQSTQAAPIADMSEHVLRLLSSDRGDEEKVRAFEKLLRETPVKRWDDLFGKAAHRSPAQHCDRLIVTTFCEITNGPMIIFVRTFRKWPEYGRAGASMDVGSTRADGRLIILVSWDGVN